VRALVVRLADWTLGPRQGSTLTWQRVVGGLVLLLAGSVLAFSRLPAGTRSVLWAEDARVFVADALARPAFGGLFESYAGYMHAFPRLAAELVVTVVPLDYVPLAVTVVACSLTGFVAALVFFLLASRIPAALPRLAVSATIAALPVAGIEVNGSIANSHWYLLIALFVILVTRQQSRTLIAVSCLTVAFAVMSDPLSAIFIPLVILRLIDIRARRELWVPLVYAGALVVQLVVVSTTSVDHAAAVPTPGQLGRAIGFRVFLVAIAGESGSAQLFLAIGTASLLIATIIVGLIGAAVCRFGRQLGGLAVASIVWAVVFFVLAIVIRWKDLYDPRVSVDWGASRYSVLPTALITIVFAAAAATVGDRLGRKAIRSIVASTALVVLVVALAAPAFSITARFPGEVWSQAVDRAVEACTVNPRSIQTIPTAPATWGVRVSCDDLVGRN